MENIDMSYFWELQNDFSKLPVDLRKKDFSQYYNKQLTENDVRNIVGNTFKKELISHVIPIPNDIEMHDQWIGIVNEKKCGKSLFIEEIKETPKEIVFRFAEGESDYKKIYNW